MARSLVCCWSCCAVCGGGEGRSWAVHLGVRGTVEDVGGLAERVVSCWIHAGVEEERKS